MLIGFNAFGEENSLIFNNPLYHSSYNRLEIYDGVIDQVYIDEDITIPYSLEKPDEWRYNTVINAKFQNSLEGGSVEANNLQIEKIRFQKRRWDELEWQNVAEIGYTPNEKIFYEIIDKYVANDFVYQYSILPITATILGNRITSQEIAATFGGIFISDKDHNYELIYDLDFGDIDHNISNAIFEPKNARYPIIVHGNLDYTSFSITATFASKETVNNDFSKIDIRMERLGKDRLLQFMKNGKPKIYRDHHGNLKLVSVFGKPKESPFNDVNGIAKLSFSLVEIGDMNNDTLIANNLIEGLTEVF